MAYPLVLEENELLSKKVAEFVKMVENLNLQLDYRDYVIENQSNEIDNLLEQKSLYQEQLDKNKSGGFIYGQVNLNGFNSYAVGFDYVFKMKLIAGANVEYNTFTVPNYFNVNMKLGIKVF